MTQSIVNIPVSQFGFVRSLTVICIKCHLPETIFDETQKGEILPEEAFKRLLQFEWLQTKNGWRCPECSQVLEEDLEENPLAPSFSLG